MTAPTPGAVLDGIRLHSHQGRSSIVMTVTALWSDGTETPLIQDHVEAALYKSTQVWVPMPRLARPTPEGEEDEAFCQAYYQSHLDHAWSCLREGKPYTVNADGAIALIQQAAADRARLKGLATPPAQPEPGAGELEGNHYLTLADLHTIKGWLHGLATAPDLSDVVADGGVSVGDCYQQEAREFAGRLERAITDHTQAQAKIARLEGEVAFLKRRNEVLTKLAGEQSTRVMEQATRAADNERRAERAEADAAKVRENTGAQAVIRDGKIEISIAVDALPLIVSGSCAARNLSGLWKVTDEAEFAKEVCLALNEEREDGTTRVHLMFDAAFDHVIEQGGEGIDEASEDEFEAEAERLQALAAQTERGA